MGGGGAYTRGLVFGMVIGLHIRGLIYGGGEGADHLLLLHIKLF